METDTPLKILFEKYAQDLLPLTGDIGAVVKAAAPVWRLRARCARRSRASTIPPCSIARDR
jgi:hypothetical protein